MKNSVQKGLARFLSLFLYTSTIAILSGLVNTKPQLPIFLTILNSLNISVCVLLPFLWIFYF